jgi:aspartate/methionine/tyrosine aminotransferase
MEPAAPQRLLLTQACALLDGRRPFTSAYKALMESQYADSAELISFHSVSKGTSGECGLRGGYHVFTNLHPDTVAQFYKLSSIGLWCVR